MSSLELTYCCQSRTAEASIDAKETIAAAILDYLHVEEALHCLDVLGPVRGTCF